MALMRRCKLNFLSLICTMLVLHLSSAWAFPAFPLPPEPQNEEELLSMHRIIDFLRDKEYPFAQSQIKSHLKNYPESPYVDHFRAMLGDIALQGKAFQEALEYYEKIEGKALAAYVQPKIWQALYQMGCFSKLYQEISPYFAAYQLQEQMEVVRCPEDPFVASHGIDDEGLFYFAEAAFREALTLIHYPEGEEAAHSLLHQALPIYISLLQNQLFASHAKLAMAEIYRLFNQPEKAVELYLELAKQEENKEVLFHAATLLLQCDKERATEIFKRLAQEEGTRAGNAAFQWLMLLAEKEEWETIS